MIYDLFTSILCSWWGDVYVLSQINVLFCSGLSWCGNVEYKLKQQRN